MSVLYSRVLSCKLCGKYVVECESMVGVYAGGCVCWWVSMLGVYMLLRVYAGGCEYWWGLIPVGAGGVGVYGGGVCWWG